MIKKLERNLFRHVLQWGTFVTIVTPEAFCSAGDLEILRTYLVAGSMAYIIK